MALLQKKKKIGKEKHLGVIIETQYYSITNFLPCCEGPDF